MFRNNYVAGSSHLRSGLAGGFYPERSETSATFVENATHMLLGFFRSHSIADSQCKKILERIHAHDLYFQQLNEADLKEKTLGLRIQLNRLGLSNELTAEAFALIREYSKRVLGMSHFDCQLIGAWIMVHGGLTEMETGEGKTLTATLAAATAALAGIPVHIVTVNDYLVKRDAELMGPLFRVLGLSVGTVTMDRSSGRRQQEYGCDIVYCTNKQLAFDYLRDRILLRGDQGRMRLQLEKMYEKSARTDRLFLRGLFFAIVDEADSVLIDEAKTPLIISKKVDSTQEEQTYEQALKVARQMAKEKDFVIDLQEQIIRLTAVGRKFTAEATRHLAEVWRGTRRREELITQALSALYLYHKDYHYLVHEKKICILDEHTGRLMPDRAWGRGLHQMIEMKEHCEITGMRETLGRLTYQKFFRRYLCLAGMTGTAKEVRQELWSVYRLPVSKVRPNKISKRSSRGKIIFPDLKQKYHSIVDKIDDIHRLGRPVLIGTRSVADSLRLSKMLEQIGIQHQVLNARQDRNEAEIVAKAGKKGSITVATNMAGRGTDIPLESGVVEKGGLHVISTEYNDSSRVDRQLYGRCGRQGDPGSYECVLSLEDGLLRHYHERPCWSIVLRLLRLNFPFSQTLRGAVMRHAQVEKERQHRLMRRDLMKKEEQLGRLLAFSGRME